MIDYVKGDATAPEDRPAIIVHVCNDIGRWGKGFVMALSKRWDAPEQAYRDWAEEHGTPLPLGEVQFVEVEDGLEVANLIGQRDVRARDGVPPIRYEAVKEGLGKVADHAAEKGASVHMPRIGAGLAGGDWDEIAALIEDTLGAAGVPVTVYDLD